MVKWDSFAIWIAQNIHILCSYWEGTQYTFTRDRVVSRHRSFKINVLQKRKKEIFYEDSYSMIYYHVE